MGVKNSSGVLTQSPRVSSPRASRFRPWKLERYGVVGRSRTCSSEPHAAVSTCGYVARARAPSIQRSPCYSKTAGNLSYWASVRAWCFRWFLLWRPRRRPRGALLRSSCRPRAPACPSRAEVTRSHFRCRQPIVRREVEKAIFEMPRFID